MQRFAPRVPETRRRGVQVATVEADHTPAAPLRLAIQLAQQGSLADAAWAVHMQDCERRLGREQRRAKQRELRVASDESFSTARDQAVPQRLSLGARSPSGDRSAFWRIHGRQDQ